MLAKALRAWCPDNYSCAQGVVASYFLKTFLFHELIQDRSATEERSPVEIAKNIWNNVASGFRNREISSFFVENYFLHCPEDYDNSGNDYSNHYAISKLIADVAAKMAEEIRV